MNEKLLNSETLKEVYAENVKMLLHQSGVFRKLIPNNQNNNQSGHPGEEGRWTESLIVEYLRRNLPSNLEVSTGFVIDKEQSQRSYQTDIIIHNPTITPPIFRYGDAVILHPGSVVAAISVKYKIYKNQIQKELEELRNIGKICSRMHPQEKGPYLALIGYGIEQTHYTSKKWMNNMKYYSRKIEQLYSDQPEMNEIIDSVISLDGAIFHISKGKDQNNRKKAKILVAGCQDYEYMLLSELLEGILKKNKYKHLVTWPRLDHRLFKQMGSIESKGFI